MRGPVRVDLDEDGNDELVVGMRCRGPGYDAASLYVFAQATDGFVPLDVPFANDGRYELVDLASADRQRLTLTLRDLGTDTVETRTLTWDGRRFGPPIGRHSAN
jgi:hypothetical protein